MQNLKVKEREMIFYLSFIPLIMSLIVALNFTRINCITNKFIKVCVMNLRTTFSQSIQLIVLFHELLNLCVTVPKIQETHVDFLYRYHRICQTFTNMMYVRISSRISSLPIFSSEPTKDPRTKSTPRRFTFEQLVPLPRRITIKYKEQPVVFFYRGIQDISFLETQRSTNVGLFLRSTLTRIRPNLSTTFFSPFLSLFVRNKLIELGHVSFAALGQRTTEEPLPSYDLGNLDDAGVVRNIWLPKFLRPLSSILCTRIRNLV